MKNNIRLWNIFSFSSFVPRPPSFVAQGAFLLFLFWLGGCATIYNPATQKNELIFISPQQEVLLGRSMSENVIQLENKPLDDPALQLRVNKIGNRIAQVSDRREIMYHFMVLDNPDLNAFALPGGYIYVYKGLIDRVDEAQLAAVLAHEIGHVAAKHSVKRMQADLGYNLLAAIAVMGLKQKNPELAQQMSAVSGTVYDLLSKGYSREDELFADHLSVVYLHRAGYDPAAMVQVMELLQTQSGPSGRVFEVLSTHPRMEERIKKIKEEIQSLDTAPDKNLTDSP